VRSIDQYWYEAYRQPALRPPEYSVRAALSDFGSDEDLMGSVNSSESRRLRRDRDDEEKEEDRRKGKEKEPAETTLLLS
jgi:hypothetical protein